MDNIKEIAIPEGWEVSKIENGKIILKQIDLPETWKECYIQYIKEHKRCYIDVDSNIKDITPEYGPSNNADFKAFQNEIPHHLGKAMLALMQLLICREVYRQGWKPNWCDENDKFCIVVINDNIKTEININLNKVLAFQSKEIRDQFLENFKDLIKEAKELL